MCNVLYKGAWYVYIQTIMHEIELEFIYLLALEIFATM